MGTSDEYSQPYKACENIYISFTSISESLFAKPLMYVYESSWLTIWNNVFMSWLEKNRLVSSANIIKIII